MTDRITPSQFVEAAGDDGWRVVGDGACAFFPTGSFAAGARLAGEIGRLEGIDDHPPDVDLRPGGVTVRLVTIADDYYGMSQREVDLARRGLLSRARAAAGDEIGRYGPCQPGRSGAECPRRP